MYDFLYHFITFVYGIFIGIIHVGSQPVQLCMDNV